MGTYQVISAALQRGLAFMGIPTNAFGGSRAQQFHGPSGRQHPCFSTPSRHELLVENRKLAGSAQRRLKRSFLQHGSIPFRVDYPFMAAALGTSPEKLQKQMIGVEEVLGRSIPVNEAAEHLERGFREILGIPGVNQPDGHA
jgi:lipoate-protein ligase A